MGRRCRGKAELILGRMNVSGGEGPGIQQVKKAIKELPWGTGADLIGQATDTLFKGSRDALLTIVDGDLNNKQQISKIIDLARK